MWFLQIRYQGVWLGPWTSGPSAAYLTVSLKLWMQCTRLGWGGTWRALCLLKNPSRFRDEVAAGRNEIEQRKGDKWRPPTRAWTFGARHLALWTFGARTIGALDNWHPGHFTPGHLAVGTIGALENWRSGTFGAQTFGAPDVWRPKKLLFS